MSKRFFILCSRPYHWWKKAKRGSFLYSVRIPTVCGTRANLRLRVCQANKLECPPHTFCSSSSQRDTTLKTQSNHIFPLLSNTLLLNWAYFLEPCPVFIGINKRRKKEAITQAMIFSLLTLDEETDSVAVSGSLFVGCMAGIHPWKRNIKGKNNI